MTCMKSYSGGIVPWKSLQEMFLRRTEGRSDDILVPKQNSNTLCKVTHCLQLLKPLEAPALQSVTVKLLCTWNMLLDSACIA